MAKEPMPQRLTVVGERERRDHHHLPEGAKCYFWGEYTPYEHTNGEKWNYSETNQLISNFKKKMDRYGQFDWRYKQEATQKIVERFSGFWQWGNLHTINRVALIPVPPSKARGDANFDPRMLNVLSGIAKRANIPLDIRDCLSFSGKYAASHESSDRPTPEQLFAELTFDHAAGKPKQPPGLIFLFDDMLTTGAHYVAVARKLGEHFPNVQVAGQFVARRIIPNPFADFDDLSEG